MGLTAPLGLPAPGRRRGPLQGLDARVILLAGLAFGVLVWRAGLAGNLLYAAAFALALAVSGATRHDARRLARSAATFALAWGGVKLALDLVARVPPGEALGGVALLCARLVVLVLLGAVLGALVTPRALGLALASLTRPVLRRSAWKLALALQLMLHFIPHALASFQASRAALRVRRVELPPTRALVVTLEAGARNLAALTWDQTLAVAARRLDGPEAWTGAPPPRPRDWVLGGVVLALAVAAAGL